MERCPLVKVDGVDGSLVEVERTDTGWFLKTPKGLTGALAGYRDGFPCRIAAGGDRDVVQFGVGPASSRLCNAFYSPAADEALLFRADGLSIEPVITGNKARGYTVTCAGPLSITVVSDYMKVHRGLPWFRPMDRKSFPLAPAGWCSWYYYWTNITEEEVAKNTDWLAENLRKFGCDWVQIDDGWSGKGTGNGTNRDWFVTHEPSFPHGMKWSADYIRSKGFRPGIWCIPFTQSDQEMWARRPELFVHNPDGSSPGELKEPSDYDWPMEDRMVEWAGRYFIDATAGEADEYLRGLCDMLCNQWGYEYVKIDAQGMMPWFYDAHRTELADPSLDGDRAYRKGLSAMKAIMGPDKFLLNCGAGWASVNLCEGIRIGGDVLLSWEGMQTGIDGTMVWVWLNTLAFYTDPDIVCVREPLPMEQARLWATLVGLTGQLLMASDKMYELAEERVELLRRIFPVADIHPMELYPLDPGNRPPVFDLKVCRPGVGEWDVVALFNWSQEEARTVEVSPARLGLTEGRWIGVDLWSGELVHDGEGALTMELPPTSCRVISVWADEGRPQFVGTSRHLTAGAVDVQSAKWEEGKARLSGVSNVVGGDPYKVRVYVPDGWRVVGTRVKQRGPIAELTIRRAENAKVRWRVDFARD
jgi:alpha-galactosidase